MSRRSQVTWLAVLAGVLSLNAYSQDQASTKPSSPPSQKTSKASDSALPREMFVPRDTVSQFFPELTRFSLDATITAVDKSVAARMASCSNEGGSKMLTLRVAQFGAASGAASAYKESYQRTQVTEADAIAIANVGQQVFGTIISTGANTEIEMTTVDNTLLVGATLAGYDATTENIAKLADLVRKELAQAQSHRIAPPKR